MDKPPEEKLGVPWVGGGFCCQGWPVGKGLRYLDDPYKRWAFYC